MNLSFREKSLWVLVTGLVVAGSWYFAVVAPGAGDDVASNQVVGFALMTLLVVLIQVVGHVVLAIAGRRDLVNGVQEDERDDHIALRGTRISSQVLNAGVFLALCATLLRPGNALVAHLLLGAWVVSTVAGIATQLVLYRRGA